MPPRRYVVKKSPVVPTIDNLIERKPKDSLLWPLELTETEYLYGKCDRHVLCQCVCGKLKLVKCAAYLSGSTRSCGHLKEDMDKLLGQRPERSTFDRALRDRYSGIRARCYNKKSKSYKKYGAKGVRMCEEWLKDANAFYKWALENGWERGKHIDKDIKGNSLLYGPDTCLIVTPKENYDARRNLIRYDYNGQKLSASEISRLTGVKFTTLYRRLKLEKMSAEQAVSTKNRTNQYGRTRTV